MSRSTKSVKYQSGKQILEHLVPDYSEPYRDGHTVLSDQPDRSSPNLVDSLIDSFEKQLKKSRSRKSREA